MPSTRIIGSAILVCLLASNACPAQALDERAVDLSIKSGIDAILNQISDHDIITYQRGGQNVTIRGRVTKASKDELRFSLDAGAEIVIPRHAISRWDRAGLTRMEMGAPHFTGPSSLAALALVTAGVPTSNPKLSSLLAVLEEGPGNDGGTYTYSLRAGLWSALLDRQLGRQQRERYKKLLKADVDWLVRASRPSGWYSYTHDSAGEGDHSNTQFANLGLWAGSIGKVEVANKHWQTMSRHWLETQQPDGGWAYAPPRLQDASRSSMTVAGCNSLYIALDRFYARPEGSYRMFEGAGVSRESRERMATIHAAIQRADKYLARHPPDIVTFQAYELFGLERLGLASGLSLVGGQDWFRAYARQTAARDWEEDVIGDCFALIFLVHGQSPIWIQKLEHGGGSEDWNYYQRDLSSLTRYLNRTFERLHRWQRVPVNASLNQLQDAPILYIAGSAGLELPMETLKTIRHYVDDGGAIFLHADRANRKFVDSATRLFEDLFADRGWKFDALPEDHPLYRCHFGSATSKWKRITPLRALRDGARLPVILCPVDIAGAWQQERGAFDELYRIMANVRVYCAPPHAELPRVTRAASPHPKPLGQRLGRLTLARIVWGGAAAAHTGAWSRFAEGLRSDTGIELGLIANEALHRDWKQAEIVHVSVAVGGLDATVVKELRAYAKGGGLVLIDAADGQAADIAAVRELLDQLDIGDRGVLASNHPIISGQGIGDRRLDNLEATDSGIGLGKTPPILTRSHNGRVAVLACPFDLMAGLDRLYIWGRIGYRADSTASLISQIIRWRLATAPAPMKTPQGP